MNQYQGKVISWEVKQGVIEVALHHAPCNEIGLQSLEELEELAAALPALEESAHALIFYSRQEAGFCAGGELNELYRGLRKTKKYPALVGLKHFGHRSYDVLNTYDATHFPA